MKTLWLSCIAATAALAFAGCTTESPRVSNQMPANPPPPPTYAPPTSQPNPEYAQRPQLSPPSYPSAPAEDYRDQAPQPDYQPDDPDIPSVENTRDFEQPLSQYGRWLDTPEYGRVWQPDDQPNDWRPYGDDGRWVYTSYGWTWESHQPWGWACFHYGNWVYRPYCGWVWVPGTVWAPAWVVWRECDDYIAWAPAPPAYYPRYYSAYDYCDGVRYVDFSIVFRHDFGKPIHRKLVVKHVDKVKIINKSKNITKTKIVNKVAHNRGPAVAKIEQATREKVKVHKVRDVAKTDQVVKETKRSVTPNAADRGREKRGQVKLDFEKPAKKQPKVGPTPLVAPALEAQAPATKRAAEEKPRAKIVYHKSADSNIERPKRPDPARIVREDAGGRRRSPEIQQPANDVKPPARSGLRDQPRDGRVSEKKPEKQARREQRHYAPPATSQSQPVVAPPVERVDKGSRKQQERYRQPEPTPAVPPAAYAPPQRDRGGRGDRAELKAERRERKRDVAPLAK